MNYLETKCLNYYLNDMNREFKEIQRFTQWYLWAFLVFIGIMPFYGIYKRILNPSPFFDDPFKDGMLLLFIGLIFGLIYLFFKMKLVTIIDNKEIRMIFKPFVVKVIRWENVKDARIVDYGFVGGWGIRYGSKYGTVYNTSGRIGLAIETTKGEKFVIGTRKHNELKKMIQNTLKHT